MGEEYWTGPALNSGIVNKVQAYVAPKIFDGINSKPSITGIGV